VSPSLFEEPINRGSNPADDSLYRERLKPLTRVSRQASHKFRRSQLNAATQKNKLDVSVR
jgi:hypothetical protein